MALPAIIAGAAAVGGLLSMYGKNREISAQKDALKAQAALARRNGMNARSGFYAQGNRFALSAFSLSSASFFSLASFSLRF